MNKLFTSDAKGHVVVCILEPGNIHRMIEEHNPILIDLNEGPWASGLPAKVRIELHYSETPVGDAKEMRKLRPDLPFEDARKPLTLTKKPHCRECKTVIEQLMVWRQEGSPWVVCCAACGAAFGAMSPMENIIGEKVSPK